MDLLFLSSKNNHRFKRAKIGRFSHDHLNPGENKAIFTNFLHSSEWLFNEFVKTPRMSVNFIVFC
ncbi:MAG: hypothetical protein CMN89_06440 [Sutterellaceae bacterium]|nr:hypothetical protein [Sutterellaceae bacterium]MBT84110.1 hypothetical protein [Sutterellaceae bacterium]|tara:strand:- start:10527 stop:10721 length:195 start_codon:yes stop_codon:yes gene_type:complete